jgi:hypothetical protein
MIERILRSLFKAPVSTGLFEEDPDLPKYAVAIPEQTRVIIGVELGEEALLGSEVVLVLDSETHTASSHLIGLLGYGPHHLRRRVLSRLVRHLIGAGWTLAGMIIVVLTLSGALQIIALIICLLFFVVDLMSISLRRP